MDRTSCIYGDDSDLPGIQTIGLRLHRHIG